MTAADARAAPATRWRLLRRAAARAWRRPMVRRVAALLGGSALAWTCAYWPDGPLREACAALVRLISGATI